ncbi:MAG TPA: autotransporter outer membrane beta-barrel domain-containing protein, partial [Pontiella sp.]|nr:autotransporter outer membrane beta-barrel domain-containing protein [Pontiella sp.]
VDYVGKASYDGEAFGASVDVGQYYHLGNLALAPYTGFRVLTINAEDHTEQDQLGSSVKVDEVTRDVAESALGLKMRHRFDTRVGRFQTTGYAEWAHDFMDDDVSAKLTADGFPSVSTASLSPDTDTVNVGLGYSWISREYMEVGIGYAGRFSENYEEHTGVLMLDIMF